MLLTTTTEAAITTIPSLARSVETVAGTTKCTNCCQMRSIIIDLFYGQLKSKVSCLGCGHESVRFDPFSLLSLPLPVENYVYLEVLGESFE